VSQRRPTVLIVDDEPAFVASLAEASVRRPEPYDIFTAGDGLEAIEVLEATEIELVVTDLRMPRLDGFGLLAWLMEHRPLVQVLVMTAFGTPELEKRVQGSGAIGILEKPISRDQLREAIQARLKQLAFGRMTGIELTSVLQLLALENKTCVLNTPGGQLSLMDGKIVAARSGELTGTQAAVAVVTAGGNTFTLGNLPQMEPTMHLPVDHLLIEVARRMDEGVETELVITDEEILGEESLSAPVDSTRGHEGSINMGNVKQSLEKAGKIDGAIAVALVDYKSGMTMGTVGGGAGFNIEIAASANTDVVRSKSKAMAALGLKDKIEDILITLSTQYHLIRTLEKHPNLFLYLALNRDQANLALARMKLHDVEKELEV
jgi:CheY-like chemotaxis protein